jgi:hypothetical protein
LGGDQLVSVWLVARESKSGSTLHVLVYFKSLDLLHSKAFQARKPINYLLNSLDAYSVYVHPNYAVKHFQSQDLVPR